MIPWWLPGKEPLVRTGSMAGLVFSQIICTDCCCPLKLQETKRRRWYHGVRSEFLHSMLQWTPMMHLFSRLSLMLFMNMCHRCAAPDDLRRFLNRRPRCRLWHVANRQPLQRHEWQCSWTNPETEAAFVYLQSFQMFCWNFQPTTDWTI